MGLPPTPGSVRLPACTQDCCLFIHYTHMSTHTCAFTLSFSVLFFRGNGRILPLLTSTCLLSFYLPSQLRFTLFLCVVSHSSCCFGTADCFSRATGAFSHILPRPRETLTDEPRSNARTHVSTRARRLTHSRLSLLLPGVSEKTRRPPPRFDWSQAKHFFLPLPLHCRRCFFLPPFTTTTPQTCFFFLSSFRK